MSSNAEALAREIADLKRRLTAVERGAQMSRTSIEGGALVVNDEAGTPVLVVGRDDDGGYVVAGTNGGQVVADTVPQTVIDEIAAELELADGAVTEAKLAAGAVTTTKIADDAITTPKVVAGAIQAAQLAVDAVAAGKIAAGAVTAREIAALAVTAAKIAAGSITADRLAIGVLGTELIADGSFESADLRASRDAVSPWTFDTGSATPRNHGQAFAVVDGDVTVNKQLFLTESIPTAAGDRFTGSFAALALNGANGTLRLIPEVRMQDGSLTYGTVAAATAGAAWQTFSGAAPVVMPAGAVSVRFFLQTAGQTAGRWCADNVSVRRLVQGVEIADGAITADKIAAAAITGKTITGGLLRTAETGKRLEIGETTVAPTGEAAIRWTLDETAGWGNPWIGAGGTPELGFHLYLQSEDGFNGQTSLRLEDGSAILEARAPGGGTAGSLRVSNGVHIVGPLFFDMQDAGMGRVGRASSTGNSAAIFAETTVLSIAGLTFQAGRAYRVRIGGAFTMTAAGIVRARLRDRTSAFTVEWADLGHFPATLANNPFALGATAYLRRTAATDLTNQTLALTLQASVAGTLHTATATSPRWIEVEDCGAAADYAYAVTV